MHLSSLTCKGESDNWIAIYTETFFKGNSGDTLSKSEVVLIYKETSSPFFGEVTVEIDRENLPLTANIPEFPKKRWVSIIMSSEEQLPPRERVRLLASIHWNGHLEKLVLTPPKLGLSKARL